MQIKRIPIERISPAAYNPRQDLRPGDPDYQKLQRSLDEFGCVEPLVWNRRTGTPGDRWRCVEHLSAEGYSAAEISEILKVSQRTIARDRIVIRQHNALERDPKLTAEMVGYLVQQAEQCVSRIRRVIRDSHTSPGVKIDGERACWLISNQLVERLQSLGYLPTAATEIRGELTHHVQHLPGFGQMQDEVARLEIIFADQAIDQQPLLEELTAIKGEVDRGALVERIGSLQAKVPIDEAASHDSGD